MIAADERVVPLLYEVVVESRDRVYDDEVRLAEEMQLHVAALCVRLEQSLLDVAEMLDRADLTFAVLKGGATAHLDYDDPARRQFGDVDLLVDPRDFGQACQAVEQGGWHPGYALPRHHERFTHAVTFRKTGVITEIDLHQHVAHRALGLMIPTDELLTCRTAFEVAGRRLWALSDLDRLIHACVHMVASRGSYRRLSTVADVLILCSKLEDRAVDVLERAEGWRIRPLVERAIDDAHATALLPAPGTWSAAVARPTRQRDRLVERAYLGEHRRPAVEELAYLRAMSSWRDRFLYVYGHLRMDSGPGSGGLLPRLRYLRSRLRQRS